MNKAINAKTINMKTQNFIKAGLITILLGGSLLYSSCGRMRMNDDELEAVSDNSTAAGASQEVQNISEQAFTSAGNMSFRGASNNGSLSACATITNDTINNVLTIDFGTSPCLCKDNRYRQGQIISSYTGKYRDSGTVISTTFSNYYVGTSTTAMNQITGTKTVTNNGHNASGNLNWTIVAALSVIKANNGGTVTFNENRMREMIAGATTPFIFSDDKFQVTGSASGTTAKGDNFTAQVLSGHELIRDMSCPKHFTQGQVDITVGSKPTMTLDYGSGTCDNTATVTRNGKTKTITLK